MSRGLSVDRRYSIEKAPSPSNSPSIDLAFIADLVDMFFISMNKYMVSHIVRQLNDWAYSLFHGLSGRKVVMPGEMDKYRDKRKVQEARTEMVQGWISVFFGDYAVCDSYE